MGLVNSFEAVALNQFDDPAKSGTHIKRERFELLPNSVVEQFYNPRYQDNYCIFAILRRTAAGSRRWTAGDMLAKRSRRKECRESG